MQTYQKIAYSILSLVILLFLVTITYAFFTTPTALGSSDDVVISTKNGLVMTLKDGGQAGSLISGQIDSTNLKFTTFLTIENGGQAKQFARIMFKGLTNTYSSDLVYTLDEVDSLNNPTIIKTIKNKVSVPSSASASNQELAQGVEIRGGITSDTGDITPNIQYFRVTIEYLYSETKDQSVDSNASFYTGFGMENGLEVFTVSYNVGEHGTTIEPSQVEDGGTVNHLPGGQIIEGVDPKYISGWYTDSNYVEEVTSTTTINSNTTLYAKWDDIPSNLADYIIVKTYNVGQNNNNPSNMDSGMYYHDGSINLGLDDKSYRYAGISDEVNNYICFTNGCDDDNKWRIVGLFDDGNGYQVKLIKYTKAFKDVWNYKNPLSDTTNEWLNGTLANRLNGAYYNGLTFKDKIDTTHEWYVMGTNSSVKRSLDVYNAEIIGGKNEIAKTYGENPAKWEGGIALIYASDYGYSALPSAWGKYLRGNGTAGYNGLENKPWIFAGNGIEWLLTPKSDSKNIAFDIGNNGEIEYYNLVYGSFIVRPSMYLNRNVEIDIDNTGDGSYTNPFIIK